MMAYKDFFGDIDPLSEVRDTVPLVPTNAKKDNELLDEPFVERNVIRETMDAEQMKDDMRLMYRMIEGMRDDLRQRDRDRDREMLELRNEVRDRDYGRERDMLALMEKLSEIQLEMTTN